MEKGLKLGQKHRIINRTFRCIGRFVGGGMKFNPQGINDDALFEVMVVK
jgi:hypothetical protein